MQYYMENHSSGLADKKDSEDETGRSEDDKCFKEVLKRLPSGNIPQRRNAIDVISEVIDIPTDSQKSTLLSTWQDVANSLLERLGKL
ncbi:hypothetical protein QN277_009054 [Acacia crassicarpa]|uniref:Uncharacterized protein n=1 Tax=Acacia crassicarpa TaxID=499986 RepID=A0AAE1M8V3_9FABA|nr:hypothetical protein QN277_009054 [Acacia crassicarpa]